jgi:putative transposase
VKYAWIQSHRDLFSVTMMCKVMNVSTSGFYESLKGERSPRSKRTAAIRSDVRRVYEQYKGIYGSYKIAEKLNKDSQLQSACRNTVALAMQEMGLKSRVSKQFKPTTTVTDPSKQPAENILSQDFQATRPNQKWVADITYLPTRVGWVYLAVVIDLFSRKVVGWSMSDRLTTPLITDAMKQAVEQRRPHGGELLHHSDRGCQYTSDAYRQMLAKLGVTCSMSRTGCCYDNAVAERFFWSLKHEWTKFESYSDLDSARWSVFKYIETFYNSERIHQTLGYKTPNQFEHDHDKNLAA